MNLLAEIDWKAWLPGIWVAARVLLILVLAWIAVSLSQRLIRGIRRYMYARAGTAEDAKRVDTIGRVFRYIAAVVISLVAGMLVLSELGVSIAPILGAAGVVGVAVGFGAQSLVKDFFSGFFMLLENQIRVGDVVNVSGKSGLVEEVTLRYVRLRDYEGNVHFIPNGEITVVSNFTLDFAYAVVDAGVAYREDADQALEIMRRVAEEMRQDAAFAQKITEPPEMVGVERWDDSAVILRVRFKVLPNEQHDVRREYLKRLKRAFDAAGVEIPYPHVTVYAGQARDGSAPSFRLAPSAALHLVRDSARDAN